MQADMPVPVTLLSHAITLTLTLTITTITIATTSRSTLLSFFSFFGSALQFHCLRADSLNFLVSFEFPIVLFWPIHSLSAVVTLASK